MLLTSLSLLTHALLATVPSCGRLREQYKHAVTDGLGCCADPNAPTLLEPARVVEESYDVEFVTVMNGDCALNVAVKGSGGPPIVFLHGWPETWHSWRHQIRAFSSTHKVIIPELRGYGHSCAPHNVQEYRTKLVASDVARVIDVLAEGRAVVVGHDWGSIVAWNMAQRFQEKVLGLMLVSVPPFPKDPAEFYYPLSTKDAPFPLRNLGLFVYSEYNQMEASAQESNANMPKFLKFIYWLASGDFKGTEASRTPPLSQVSSWGTYETFALADANVTAVPDLAWSPANVIALQAATMLVNGIAGPNHYYANVDADWDDWQQDFGNQSVPVTVPSAFIAGEFDNIRGVGVGAGIPDMYAHDPVFELMKDLRSKTIVDAIGHWTQQENPEAFNAALRNFLHAL